EVDGGGSVTNGVGGAIGAARGNVTLVGRDVNQNGRVSATSAVGRNGSIRLLARDNVVTATTSNGIPTVQATRTGALVLGEGSVTEVVPERDSAATSRDDVAFDKSTVELVGRTVHLKQDAAVLAAGGVVDITAQDGQFFETATQARQSDVRVQLDPGARIDVAGLRDVDVPVERNVLQIELRGDELKDAPLQRQGVLRNKTVFVDAREGTSLLDISPFLGQVERTVAERSAPGGEIRIRSEGDVVLRAGASLDVSGGSIRYGDGILNTTKLISDRGLVDISDASPDVLYRGIAGIYETTDAKWGVTRRYQTLPGTLVQGYLEGKDAGTIRVLGHRLVLDADLRGKVVTGPLQVGAGTLPQGGRLVLGDAAQTNASNPDFLLPSVRFTARPPILPADFTFMTGLEPTPLPAQWEEGLTLDPQRLSDGGFSRLEVYSNGRIEVDTPLSLAAGGALRLAGRELDIRQDIVLPAGSIRLSTHDAFARTPTEQAAASDVQRHGLRLADGVSLRARGLWSNALLSPAGGELILPDGGTVTLSSVADLTLGSGSLIDVTGGGQVDPDGRLEGGKGGSISLS
ncbi:MAG TPA: hypothetical protein VHN38_02460, partial [Immundisolibacter sp.]|nr:hypothetical protein [Immundisolibacter sp.]